MTARPMLPGVPAAGHISSSGFWHPGRPEGCVKCPVPPTASGCKCSHPAHRARCGVGGCPCRTYRPIRSSR